MSGLVVLLLRVLLALALYAFLGLALWILWQDLRQAVHNVSSRAVPAIRLEIINQKQPARFRAFSQPEVFLGRDPDCDVRLVDPLVSARHALLSFHHGQWWLDDLGSSNGTRLNREKVDTATVLTTGDEIQCGRATVLISLTGEGMAYVPAGEDGQNG
jgi:pSer/pThr/pTyr-binding forkhead associated (FHA) protein